MKTTGGKGLHLVVPIERRHDWEFVERFCHGVALAVDRAAPQQYVATMSKSKRTGKIFVDYLRNQRGATAVAPYSTRARAVRRFRCRWPGTNSIRSDRPLDHAVANAARRLSALSTTLGPNWPTCGRI